MQGGKILLNLTQSARALVNSLASVMSTCSAQTVNAGNCAEQFMTGMYEEGECKSGDG